MIPPYGITKDEHDALCEHRDRPLTDDPIRLRGVTPPAPNARTFHFDGVMLRVSDTPEGRAA